MRSGGPVLLAGLVAAVPVGWTVAHRRSPLVGTWTAPDRTADLIGPLGTRRFGPDRHDRLVVWLHGLGTTGRYFGPDPIGADVARVVVPDLLGFGASRHAPASTFGLADHADAVVEVVDAMSGPDTSVVVCAHSMGSAVALAVSARLGDRVERTVLCGAPMYAPDDSDAVDPKNHDALISWMLQHGNNARWLIGLNERHPDAMGWFWSALGPSMPTDLARDASLHTFESLRQSIRALVVDVDWNELIGMATAVDILRGSSDELGNVDFARDLARHHDHVAVRIIDGAGHHLPITHRPEVLDAVGQGFDATDD